MSKPHYHALAAVVGLRRTKVLAGMLQKQHAEPAVDDLAAAVADAANKLHVEGYALHSVVPLAFPTMTKEISEPVSGSASRGALVIGALRA